MNLFTLLVIIGCFSAGSGTAYLLTGNLLGPRHVAVIIWSGPIAGVLATALLFPKVMPHIARWLDKSGSSMRRFWILMLMVSLLVLLNVYSFRKVEHRYKQWQATPEGGAR
jgi:hypothetical protein